MSEERHEGVVPLDPAQSGVELSLDRGDDLGALGVAKLRVNGNVYNVSRKDARALGLALLHASSWDPAPRFHVCDAPNLEHSGDRHCKAELGHARGHTWDPDLENRAEPAPPARRWRFQ